MDAVGYESTIKVNVVQCTEEAGNADLNCVAGCNGELQPISSGIL
jgi:hypothetical protein